MLQLIDVGHIVIPPVLFKKKKVIPLNSYISKKNRSYILNLNISKFN